MSEQEIGLTEQNFLTFAAKHYDNVFYDDVELQEDLRRFIYIKRLFNQYLKTGELKERLIINHLVVIFNVWPRAANPMLFLKLKGYEQLLKTFLVFLERMPDAIIGIGLEKRKIISDEIPIDYKILDQLKKNV